jgi:hypothetical protein
LRVQYNGIGEIRFVSIFRGAAERVLHMCVQDKIYLGSHFMGHRFTFFFQVTRAV